MALLMLYAKVS